jgi:phosphopantothenoylcysteine synthetase/decarboxylase
MTADAERFVGTPTFEALSGHPVADDLYAYPDSPIPHIFLADWADLVVVVPATGNVLAKMAMGIADDCLSTTLLAAHCPVLVAAAMNVHMWRNPATQANVATLPLARHSLCDAADGAFSPAATWVRASLRKSRTSCPLLLTRLPLPSRTWLA